MLFGRREQTSYTISNGSLVIDASRLKPNERLQFNYNHKGNIIGVQKVKLSLFERGTEGKAETDIPPGGVGRVSYHGTSWKASNDSDRAIVANENVLVTARQDLTLLITPTI